ncbi:MAG: trypsin-like serine peptidase, partial [Angustibacter sp.]
MKHTLRPLASVAAAATVLVLGASPAAARGSGDSPHASPAAAVRGPARHSALALAAKQRTGSTAGYWTGARMRAALPAEGQPGLATAANRQRGALSADRAVAQRQVTRNAAAHKLAPKPTRFPPRAAAGASTLALPSGHPVARTNGKVFFTNAGNGLNYVCSAAVVNSEGRDTVWTAGHCVHGGAGQNWHLNWTFVPAYDNGAMPQGSWTAAQL